MNLHHQFTKREKSYLNTLGVNQSDQNLFLDDFTFCLKNQRQDAALISTQYRQIEDILGGLSPRVEKFQQLQDSQYQNQLFNPSFQINEEDDKEKFCQESQRVEVNTRSKPQKREGKRTQLKNFLNIAKRCLLRLCQKKLSKIKNTDVCNFLKAKTKTTRKQFEQFFKVPEVRLILVNVFKERGLQRQIQNSRIDSQNRKIFREEIDGLRKMFIESKCTCR